jgi:hypothetical protein
VNILLTLSSKESGNGQHSHPHRAQRGGQGRLALGRLALGRFALGRFALGRFALGRLALGRFALGRLALGRLALGLTPTRSLEGLRIAAGDMSLTLS